MRGRGLMQGLAMDVRRARERGRAAAFERGLIMETSGTASQVVKVLPPLTIEEAALDRGLGILAEAAKAAVAARAGSLQDAAD